MKRRTLFTIIIALTVWLLIVVASGLGWNPAQKPWDFSNTGAFGDSFGPLGALMAALAAYAAFETLNEQRNEISRTKLKDLEEDRRREKEARRREKREKDQLINEQRTVFESTFFNLLNAFRDIARETDVGTGDSRRVSRDAFQKICATLVRNFEVRKSLDVAWSDTNDAYKNDLNHYFRFLYHIILFTDCQKKIDNYFYVRLVRAALSEAELILLFANCAAGEGKNKFLPLVEKYALLHNISENSRKNWKMNEYINASAFEHHII